MCPNKLMCLRAENANANTLKDFCTVSHFNTMARNAKVLAGSLINLLWKKWWKWCLGTEQMKWLIKCFHQNITYFEILDMAETNEMITILRVTTYSFTTVFQLWVNKEFHEDFFFFNQAFQIAVLRDF